MPTCSSTENPKIGTSRQRLPGGIGGIPRSISHKPGRRPSSDGVGDGRLDASTRRGRSDHTVHLRVLPSGRSLPSSFYANRSPVRRSNNSSGAARTLAHRLLRLSDSLDVRNSSRSPRMGRPTAPPLLLIHGPAYASTHHRAQAHPHHQLRGLSGLSPAPFEFES